MGQQETPGHPEYGHTPGVEITTGPLGRGLANAVGMAIGEAHLAARYNRDGHTVIDHHTWAIVSDGDLMEGVVSEAASPAGHLKLACLYDDNHVTLAAGTDITFCEDRAKRFEAYGWQTLHVSDGNDVDMISATLDEAQAETAHPLDRVRYASAEGLRRGAYVLSDAKDGKPQLILIASGFEVNLILAAADRPQGEGILVRCVSMPSWELFENQPQSYRDSVLPPDVSARLAVELGVPQGWDRYTGARGDMLGVERFGASAPAEVLLREYGFTVDNVCARARALLA